MHSLKDVIAFNDAHTDQEMPYFGQEIMLQAEKKGPLTEAKYLAELAKDRRMSRTLGIDAVMTRYKLDALVAPTGGPPWLIDLVNGDAGERERLDDRRRGGLPAHHGAGRLFPRPPGRDLVHRPGLERGHADQAGVCVRAGDEAAPPADVRGDGRPGALEMHKRRNAQMHE